MRTRILLALTALTLAAVAAAQTQAPPQKPPAQAVPPATTSQAPTPAAPRPQAPAQAAATRVSMAIAVTDFAGEAAPGVRVALTGPVAREGTTARDGIVRFQTLRAGTYRLRFESPDFVTFEREVTVKAGPLVEVEVTLSRVPEKPAPPPPAPVPSAPIEAPAVAPNPSATVELLALPDWIERNLIGRGDPQRETVVGRAPGATARVVQVRDPIKDRVRGDADEMLYVIAGEGVLRVKGRAYRSHGRLVGRDSARRCLHPRAERPQPAHRPVDGVEVAAATA